MVQFSKLTALQKKLSIAVLVCTLVGMGYGAYSIVKKEFRSRVVRVIRDTVKERYLKGYVPSPHPTRRTRTTDRPQ